MRRVNVFEKLMASVVNVIIVSIVFLPFLVFFELSLLLKKLIFVSLFLLYKLFFIFVNKNRTVGMIVMRTHWKRKYLLKKQILHAVLYTLSFSTLLFWIVFPFDLFLVNMLLLQLPSMKLTGMTLHEFLSGKMEGVKRRQ